MRIYNPTYKKIAINWDSVELPVNEGTPFAADGTIANTSDAIGLLPVYIWKKPIDEEVYILIGGDVYQSEVEAAFGAELTDDAIASMGGINFYENDGTIDKSSGGGGGGSDFFEVHFDEDEGTLDKTWKEIEDALLAGTVPFYVLTYEEEIQAGTAMYLCNHVQRLESLYTTAFTAIVYNNGPAFDSVFFTTDSENGYPIVYD